MNSKELIAQYRAGRRDFQNIDISGIDLTWAILSDSDFRGANLQGVIFSGATLNRVNFSGHTNLRLADLSRADLIEANLNGANLEGANLTGANLSRVSYDEKTTFPRGFHTSKSLDTSRISSTNSHSNKDWENAIAQKLTHNLDEARQETLATAQADRDAFWAARDAKPIEVEWADIERKPLPPSNSSALTTIAIAWECLHTLKAHKAAVSAVTISCDGKWLASGGDDRAVYLWDFHTGRYAFSFLGQSQGVTSVVISPNAQIIASGCFDQKITSWHLESHKLLRTYMQSGAARSHNGPVYALAFTPSGKKIVSGGADQTIKIWNVHTGSLMRTLKGHSAAVTAVSLSPDGNTLISGSVDQNIALWNLDTHQLLHRLTGHKAWIHALAISPDGQTLVSASNDGVLKVWNLAEKLCLYSIAAHVPGATSVALSPDGQLIASASSSDRTIKLWNFETGQPLGTLDGQYPVTFSSDGNKLVSGGNNHMIKIWQRMT